MLILAGDERIGGDELPVLAGGVLEVEGGAGEGVEAPEAGDGAGDGGGFGGSDFVGGLVGRGGFGLVFPVIFLVIRGVREGFEGQGFAVGQVGEDEAALKGVGGERDFGLFAGVVEVEDEVVGEGRGEDERSAFDGKDDGGLEEAGDGLGIGGAQRRRDGGF